MCLTERMGEPGGAVAAPPTGAIAGTGELFQLLRDGRARTRAELAACTGLARSTVAARVDALLASGLVGHAGEATSTGGTTAHALPFNPGGARRARRRPRGHPRPGSRSPTSPAPCSPR